MLPHIIVSRAKIADAIFAIVLGLLGFLALAHAFGVLLCS